MDEKAKIKLTIDGKEVMTTEGATILDAAKQNGIYIPTLCHHPAVSNWGGCRMCMVEVDGAPKLVASCVMPVRPGMEVVTTSEKILESRRTVLEFLFAERNHNCMFCPQSGDCELQKLAYELKMDHLGMEFAFDRFPTDATSEHMVMDHNRCILCGRCVRACSELAGNFVLSFQNRGPKSLVGMDLNASREDSSCVGCGLCLQLCPTGAIYNRYRAHYAVKGHAKDWKEVESSCPECGLLCPTVSRVRSDSVLRVEGSPSVQPGRPDRGQLCYKGRFEVLRASGRRLLRPLVKNGSGDWKEETWEKALSLVAAGLKNKNVFGLASSGVSNEGLHLFKELVTKGWGAEYADTLDGDAYRTLLSAWKERAKGFREASWKRVPDADMIMILGRDPHESQPLIGSLIRRSVMEKGVKAVSLGEAGRLPQPLVQCISAAKGKGTLLIQAFLKAVCQSKGRWPEEVLKRVAETAKGSVKAMLKESGLEDENGRREFEAAVSSYVSSKNPLVIAGEGSDPSALGSAVDLALLKGPLTEDTLRVLVLKPNGNSAGAWSLGVASEKERSGKGPRQGGFLLLGRDQELTPDMAAKWGRPEFLAVLTPYIPEGIDAKAAVLIPVPAWMEAEGTYTSLDGMESGHRKGVLNPPEGVRPSWETLVGLARLSGTDPGLKELGEVTKKAAEASSKGRWS
jgi:formate dehydrogenase major subunit